MHIHQDLYHRIGWNQMSGDRIWFVPDSCITSDAEQKDENTESEKQAPIRRPYRNIHYSIPL